MNAPDQIAVESAPEKSIYDIHEFLGVDNSQNIRVIHALLKKPRIRKELYKIVGCCNGSELVVELHRRGLDIPCKMVEGVNRDDKIIKYDLYSLSNNDQRKIQDWFVILSIRRISGIKSGTSRMMEMQNY